MQEVGVAPARLSPSSGWCGVAVGQPNGVGVFVGVVLSKWRDENDGSKVGAYIPRALVPVVATNRNERGALVLVRATNRYQRSFLAAQRAGNRDLWYQFVARTGTIAPLS